MQRYNITPVPKPRMTQSDRWKKRPVVLRYWEFKNQVQELGIKLATSGDTITFGVPMPKSWSKKKKRQMNDLPHQQTPDLDNFLKALYDACFEDDRTIWSVSAKKVWSVEGFISVANTPLCEVCGLERWFFTSEHFPGLRVCENCETGRTPQKPDSESVHYQSFLEAIQDGNGTLTERLEALLYSEYHYEVMEVLQ